MEDLQNDQCVLYTHEVETSLIVRTPTEEEGFRYARWGMSGVEKHEGEITVDAVRSDAITATGIGLRLGSSEILGRNVIRLDLAFPLDDVLGVDYEPSLSFAVGQVFTFFGNNHFLNKRTLVR